MRLPTLFNQSSRFSATPRVLLRCWGLIITLRERERGSNAADSLIHHVHQPADVCSSVTVGQIRTTEG